MKKLFKQVLEKILITLAKIVLLRHKPRVIAVTGSAGKTTTKYAIACVLFQAFGQNKVYLDKANLGTVTGIPLAVLKISVVDLKIYYWFWLLPFAFIKTIYYLFFPYPQYLILEVSADIPGDIKKTVDYLKPIISVVTNIGASHLEYFKTVEGVANEKKELIVHTKKDGLVVLNGDDSTVLKMRSEVKSDLNILSNNDGKFAQNTALEIGLWLGIEKEVIDEGINSFIPPKGRFTQIDGKKDTIIIDSTYNANPVSVKWAIDELKKQCNNGSRSIVVLGDMLELGEEKHRYHQEIGEYAKNNCDYLITIGVLTKDIVADFHTRDWKEAYYNLLRFIEPGDTILVKASHGMHLEKLVEKLKR